MMTPRLSPSLLVILIALLATACGTTAAPTLDETPTNPTAEAELEPTSEPTPDVTPEPTPELTPEPLPQRANEVCQAVMAISDGEIGSMAEGAGDLDFTMRLVLVGEAGAALTPFGEDFASAVTDAHRVVDGFTNWEVTPELHEVATEMLEVCETSGWAPS